MSKVTKEFVNDFRADIDVRKDYTLTEVPVGLISTQDRARTNWGEDFDDLVKSIENKGLIQPICVMLDNKKNVNGDQLYILLSGGRRYRAVNRLNYTTVPCKVYPYLSDPRDRKIIELEENIKRKNLDWPEEVKLKREIDQAYKERYGRKLQGQSTLTSSGHTMSDTANLLGTTQASVSRDIKLAQLLDEMPELAECKTRKEALLVASKKREELLAAELARRATKNAAVAAMEDSSTVVKRYDDDKMNLMNSYIIGDCLIEMAKSASNVANLIDLDWPYGIELTPKKSSKGHISVVSMNEAQAQALGANKDLDKGAYISFMRQVLHECFRLLKPNGWLIVWYAIDPWHSVTVELLREVGFTVGPPAMWIKPGYTQSPNTRLSNSYEPFMYARKGEAVINKAGRDATFAYGLPKNRSHPTEKPIELMQDIIHTFTFNNTTILAPFLGSGNTLLAASNLGRKCYGWDLDETYRNSFIVKANASSPGKYTSY